MKTNLYTFYDKLARQAGPIQHGRSDEEAQRQFVNALKENQDRNDFVLWHLGEFDHDSGVLKVNKQPRVIEVSFPSVDVESVEQIVMTLVPLEVQKILGNGGKLNA